MSDLEDQVQPHLRRMLSVAERILGCPDAAADAVQEAIITLWSLGDVPPNLRAWLFRTVVHRSLHSRRSTLRRRKWEDRAGAEWAEVCPLCDPEQEVLGAELRREITAVLASLEEDQRQVVALRELEGLDYDSIANRLDVPVGTVRSRLNRARSALRSKFGRIP